jgi:hypothetical protein
MTRYKNPILTYFQVGGGHIQKEKETWWQLEQSLFKLL